ncbi:MAG TPA: hypothetical protein VJV96_09550 [Candidatus Angelobacter sp.]|nr:hypothetical protein [Candidatus Angelobacter sp.]
MVQAVVLAAATSALVFTCTFGAVSLYWSRFHLKPGEASPADGAVIIEAGLILGVILGTASALIVLLRLWPKRPEAENPALE